MKHMNIRHLHRSAFTLVELIVVIVVLAVLSAVAIPKYIDYSGKAKESAVRGVLGNTRSAIANFYSNSALSGTATWPTLTQIQTFGSTGVLQEPIPANPYITSTNAASISAATWAATPPVTAGASVSGWNYDAATGKFWANSNTTGVAENLW